MDERRRLNPRLEIELPVEYRVTPIDEPRQGTITNLCVGGAAILTETQLPAHSLLDQFRFSLPDQANGDPVEGTAIVVHARPRLDDQGTIVYVSGLHFLGLETSAFERLERFVLNNLDKHVR